MHRRGAVSPESHALRLNIPLQSSCSSLSRMRREGGGVPRRISGPRRNHFRATSELRIDLKNSTGTKTIHHSHSFRHVLDLQKFRRLELLS
jgi:hypothetical protein